MATAFVRRDALKLGLGVIVLGGGFASRAASVAAEAGPPLPISIITSDSNMTNTLIELIRRKRYLEDLELAPTILQVADASKVMPAMISGEADICVLNGISLLFPAIARGAKLKLLGGSCLLPQIAVYSSKPDIKSVADLKGRTIGTGALGALTHQLMVALLKKKGVDPATVTFRNVGSNADIFRAVVAGTVDAGPSGIDVYDQQAKYHTHSLSDGDLWTELPEYTYQGTFTSDRAIADKREALVRTLAAFARLYRFVQSPDSQDLFIQSYAKAVGNPDPAEAESTWTFIQKIRSYAVDIVLSEERIRYMQDLNVELGVQKSVLPTNEVADSSLAREALKLLA